MLQWLRRLNEPGDGSLAPTPSATESGARHEGQEDNPLSRWLVHMLNQGQAQGNVACRVTVERVVSPALLTEAFRSVLARHDMLRTCYVESGGQLTPWQLDVAAFKLQAVDLSRVPGALRPAELARRMLAETLHPFDLSSSLPIRAVLFSLSPAHSVLLAAAHDLACDAESLCIVLAEVQEVLRALEAGAAVPSGKVPQFKDHSRWLLRHSAGPGGQSGIEFWKRTLQGMQPSTMPGGKRLRDAATPQPGAAELVLPEHLATALRATPPGRRMAVGVGAVAALLHRHCAEDDVVLGLTTSTRREQERQAVGRFATTLALRLDLAGKPDGATLLDRVEAALAAAHAHRHISLNQVAEAFDPDNREARRLVLPVEFEVRDGITADRGCNSEPSPFRAKPPDDLLFGLVLSGPARLTCDYRAGCREADAVQRLLRTLARLLEGLLSTPDEPVHALPVLDGAERHELLVTLNQTAAAYPSATAAQLFEDQAQATPGATALVCDNRRMSYGELAAASNRLARCLAAHGARPGKRVGICLERGPEMVVALLAVLKTGAAYVPLDPTYPADRLSYMLADCGACLVLCQTGLPPGVQAAGAAALELDAINWATGDPTPLAATVTPDSSAYVIYTSGSTGRPKGVELPHRALTNLLSSMRKQPGFGATDKLLAVTSFSFDIATMELLLPLVAGGQVVIARQPEVADGGALLDLLRRHEITVMQATPSRWRLVVEAGWTGEPRLKAVVGGEALPRSLADELLARGEVWNVYGPTETTIWSTIQRVEPGLEDVPIGHPIDNTFAYVLDQHSALLPRGAVGELYIGGDGVGVGYVGLPALTGTRFLPDPFRPLVSCGRMYRSGDLVRWRDDGALDYLRRADHQIKLRGLRIEPGEIESVLQRHPIVRQAVVLKRASASTGEDALVAYVVSNEAQAANRDLRQELEALLQRHLPRFMHPDAIVALPLFPLTLNGKVDRSALPTPPRRPGRDATGTLPATATERRLASAWQKLLGLPAVSVLDNFFDLGGTSLLSARLLAEIQANFGQRLSVATLHEASTLGALARLIDQAADATAPIEEPSGAMQVVHLQRAGEGTPIFGLHNTTIFYPLARFLGSGQSFIAVEASKRLGSDRATPVGLPEIAASYLREIQRLRPHGPYVLLGWCAGGVIAYETAQQLVAQGHAVPLVIMVDADAPNRAAGKPALQMQLGRASYLWQRAWSYGRRMLLRRDGAGISQRRAAPVTRRDRREAQQEKALHLVERQMIRELDRAIRVYRPVPYAGRVLLFQRDDRPTGWFIDPTAGWGSLVSGRLEIRRSAGDHVTLFRDENARFLAEQIARTLAD